MICDYQSLSVPFCIASNRMRRRTSPCWKPPSLPSGLRESHPSRLHLRVFPCNPTWGPAEDARLQALAGTIDAVVAIERAGPGRDGGYRTMRGRRMDHLVAPLEKLLAILPSPAAACTVGIGDGGNEWGMGKVEARVLASTAIPNARDNCCVVPTR